METTGEKTCLGAGVLDSCIKGSTAPWSIENKTSAQQASSATFFDKAVHFEISKKELHKMVFENPVVLMLVCSDSSHAQTMVSLLLHKRVQTRVC